MDDLSCGYLWPVEADRNLLCHFYQLIFWSYSIIYECLH
jgi:hypothetical protein